jgi:hypothetical protein
MDRVGLCYTYFVIFDVLGLRGICLLFGHINSTLEG